MNSNTCTHALFALALLSLAPAVRAQLQEREPAAVRGADVWEERRISLAELEAKIRGGWAGQMIGVSYGTPTEFRWLGKMIEVDIPWLPEFIRYSIGQDDCYVDMTFAEVLDRKGLDASMEDFGEAFARSKYKLWHANAGARKWLNRGIKPPLTGHPKYNIHANDIDFQIEADFIGLMTPGLPLESNKYCERVGRVMNHGDGLYGGMFVCGMYAAAFFEDDERKVVEAGLACIPAESGYGKIVADVLRYHEENPRDWEYAWEKINADWDRGDSCSDGAMSIFNIDARLNGAYIAIGMLYGEGDFSQSMEITTRCGQDSDCNPSNSAGVMGTILGYEAIPDYWKSGIPAIAQTKFDFTEYSFDNICAATLARAKEVIRRAGGRVTQTEAIVPRQKPVAPKLEQWEMGKPDKKIKADDPAWTWDENWTPQVDPRTQAVVTRSADAAGADASIRFTGVAAVIVGPLAQDLGMAEVFLDGKPAGELDAYIVESTFDNDLWHVYGIEDKEHEIRIVARGQADPRSTGRKVVIGALVTYR